MEPLNESPLKTLEEDIRRLQRKTAPKSAPQQADGGQFGLRMGLELASGVLVGAGVGILLDRWLDTSPILCIVCFMLGAGGGFLTIVRTMKAMDKTTEGEPAPLMSGKDDEDEL